MKTFTLLKKHFKNLFRFKMVAKTIFWYFAILLIYANSEKNDGVHLNFVRQKKRIR